MIPITVFAGKRVAVFGLARSGMATAEALKAGSADPILFDDSEARCKQAREAGYTVTDLRSLDWSDVAGLSLSPGVPLTHPTPHWTVLEAQRAGVPIIGDLELFCLERAKQAPQSPFVAITGTNGKSTTTALIGHLLKDLGFQASVGGNIGEAVLTLPAITPHHHHVIECSSYQIDLTPSLNPLIGMHLNLSPDHLDRHGSMDNYAAVKERLISGVQGDGAAIVGVDDPYSSAIADRAEQAGKTVWRVSVKRTVSHGIEWRNGNLIQHHNGAETHLFSISDIETLRGAHNGQNAAAAVAALMALRHKPDVIRAALATFPGLKHRMELVRTHKGIRFINDSKATNVDSAHRALSSYEAIYWIAGGRAKEPSLGDLSPFYDHIKKAYLIGEAAENFAEQLKDHVPFTISKTLDDALSAAMADAERDGLAAPAVLLSPACASFDQYPDFEARGDAFRSLVNALT